MVTIGRVVTGRPAPREFVSFERVRSDAVHAESGYVQVDPRPLLRLALEKVAVAAVTRIPYASPGALTHLLLEAVSLKVYCRVSGRRRQYERCHEAVALHPKDRT